MRIFTSLADPDLASLLNSGAAGVLPTDTVYGLVCRAADEQAVARLYALKQRDHKPGTLIGADIGQFATLGIKARYLKAVEHLWPGPISVIVPTTGLTYLNQGVVGLALRVPAPQNLRELLIQTGPLQTTSANISGRPTASTVAEAQAYFGDSVDFYVDGGDLSGRPPSTIVRIVDDAIEVLREGAVKLDAYGRIAGSAQ